MLLNTTFNGAYSEVNITLNFMTILLAKLIRFDPVCCLDWGQQCKRSQALWRKSGIYSKCNKMKECLHVKCKPALGTLPFGSCAVILRQVSSVAERSQNGNFKSSGPRPSG